MLTMLTFEGKYSVVYISLLSSVILDCSNPNSINGHHGVPELGYIQASDEACAQQRNGIPHNDHPIRNIRLDEAVGNRVRTI